MASVRTPATGGSAARAPQTPALAAEVEALDRESLASLAAARRAVARLSTENGQLREALAAAQRDAARAALSDERLRAARARDEATLERWRTEIEGARDRDRRDATERGREATVGKRVELEVGVVPSPKGVDGGRVHCQRRLLRPVAMYRRRRRAPAQSMIELAQRRVEALEDQHGVERRENRLGALRVGEGDVARVRTCAEIKILRRVRAESSRRPPRHRRDACSMAWRCRFLTARRSQHGRVIAAK